MIPRSLPLSAALLLPLAALALSGSAAATDDIPVAPDFDVVEYGGPVYAYGGPGRDIAVPDDAIYGIRGGGQVQYGGGASPAKTPEEARELGADWLAGIRNKDGGWGAGAWGDANAQQASDVATTAMVVMALAEAGDHDEAVKAGTMFIIEAIEASDPHSPRLRTPEGTQPQYKLGQLVDTHLAALALSEVNGQFDQKTNDKVAWALDYVVGKVQMAQQADGSFDSNGWAPVLSSSIAAMSLYNAAEQGVEVREEVFDRAERYQTGNIDSESGRADASAGAGVELYAAAGGLRNSQRAAGRGGAMSAPAQEAQDAMARRVDKDAEVLMSGFGSVGGEEMLSYMMISDALAEEGGATWEKWDERMGAYLLSIQNADGSWVGHHCITSPVFVTAGAVLTLSADAPTKGKPQRSRQSETAERSSAGAPLTAVDPAP
ncbi:MAG: hypothetical protein H6740_17650 [Alphaproteobacteria bacterium]|nr:hypothetical protein [Alphaproteobacteria bacterium]